MPTTLLPLSMMLQGPVVATGHDPVTHPRPAPLAHAARLQLSLRAETPARAE